MDLSVLFQKSKDKNQAYHAVKGQITPFYLDKWKFKVDRLDYNEETCKIYAEGKKFRLSFFFSDTSVEVELDVSLIYRPFKASVLSKIESELRKVI